MSNYILFKYLRIYLKPFCFIIFVSNQFDAGYILDLDFPGVGEGMFITTGFLGDQSHSVGGNGKQIYVTILHFC